MHDENGNKTKETLLFLSWIDDIKFLLPPKMTISEAHDLYNRKIREERELKIEKN